MPRPNKGARLWLKPSEIEKRTGKVRKNAVWIIRDGPLSVVTGCAVEDRAGAEKALADFITAKYQPGREKDKSASEILVTDVLAIYAQDVAHKHARPEKTDQRLMQLAAWWKGKTLADVNERTCLAYEKWRTSQPWKSARPEKTGRPARMVTSAGVRRELEDMRAAITYHRKKALCRDTVEVTLPARPPATVRWLTRDEAVRLLWVCWRHRETQHIGRGERKGDLIVTVKHPWRHLARFILIGLYTGTRSHAICRASFTKQKGAGFIDLDNGLYHRLLLGAKITDKRQPSIRLPRSLLAHMRRWERLSASGFAIEFNGESINEPNKAFASAVEAAGMDPEEVTPHVLRHTCATWMLQAGATVWDVAGYLGMSVQMVQSVYGHQHPDYQASAIAAAGGRRRGAAIQQQPTAENKSSKGDRMGTETPGTDGDLRSRNKDAA